MPTVTLADLTARCYDRLENNTVLYTAAEVTSAINEGISVLNLFTGFLQYTDVVSTVAGTSIYSTPSGILFATRVAYSGTALKKTSIGYISQTYPNWQSDTADIVGMGPTYWFPVGTEKFGVFPAPSANSKVLTVTGVQDAPLLVFSTDAILYPSEYADAIEDYATHVLQLKAAGIVAKASMFTYQGFMGRMNELKRYRSKIQPHLWIETDQQK